MERTLVTDTINKIGDTVFLKGWVNTRRDHGKIVFIDLRDRTGLVQVVMTGDQAGTLHSEDVIYVTGLVKARPEKLVNPKLPTGTVEIETQSVELVSKAADLPFDMGQPELNVELPTLLDYRALTLRHPRVQAIFKVQEVVIDAFRKSLQARNFVEFQAPSIISSVPEGGAEVFRVKYFDYEAYLSQSPQLYKSLLVGAFERVFSVNQIFRAEPSVTTRHITVSTSLDAEFGFIDSWKDVLEMQEYVVKYIFSEVQSRCAEELALYNAVTPQVSDTIPLIKLRQAQQIIFERTGRDCRQKKDLAPEDEKEICRWSKEVHNSELVYVSHFVTKKKPFYVYPDPADPEYAFSVDLLGRGVEWSSGGQRLHDYQTIRQHVKDWGLKEADVELYLQSFKYAVPPLGGFALGAERMTMNILGLSNIREASMFPRDMERIDIRLSTVQKKSNLSSSGEEVYQKITSLLDKNSIKYQKFEHEPVFTSEQAAKVRGTRIEQGAKALVMFADKQPILAVVSAAKKIDSKKLKNLLKVKDLHLATAGEVKSLTGLEIGSIPPFGSVLSLKTYVDNSLSSVGDITFNAGLHTKSLSLRYQDYVKAEAPQTGDFS